VLLQKATTDKIQLVTSAAGTVDVLASWVDNNAGTIDGDSTASAITTATTTDIVAAPASSVIRNTKTINVRNKHASNSNTVTVQWTDGTTTVELFKLSLAAGEVLTYVEGIGWVVYASDGVYKAQTGRVLLRSLSADDTGGANSTTAQPWFPTTGGVTVAAATAYFFEGWLLATRTAGTTSHTTGIIFAGTATISSLEFLADWRTGDANAAAAVNKFRSTTGAGSLPTTELVVKAASTSATEDIDVEVRGIARINAAGTFIPQFKYSATPGGTPTIKRGSYFRMWPVGDNTVTTVGTWA
jgi:hypothetical protein